MLTLALYLGVLIGPWVLILGGPFVVAGIWVRSLRPYAALLAVVDLISGWAVYQYWSGPNSVAPARTILLALALAFLICLMCGRELPSWLFPVSGRWGRRLQAAIAITGLVLAGPAGDMLPDRLIPGWGDGILIVVLPTGSAAPAWWQLAITLGAALALVLYLLPLWRLVSECGTEASRRSVRGV